MDYLMNHPVLLNAAIAALVVLGGYLGYVVKNKHNNEYAFTELLMEELSRVKAQLLTAESELRKCNQLNLTLYQQLSELKLRLELFEHSQADFPFPVWMKDTQFRMIYVNNAYEDTYLKPLGLSKEDYIGKYDFEVWDKETADVFKEHDLKVLDEGKPLYIVENIPINNKVYETFVIKYRRDISGVPIGIAGVAMPHFSNET